MKKHLFNFVAIIAFVIFSSSCSVMKRHYGNGYYISHNSIPATNKVHERGIEKKTTPSLYTIQNTPDNGSNLNPIPLIENEFVSANNKKEINKKPSAIHEKHLGYTAPKIIQTEENKKSLTARKSHADDVVVDALSLFWIIILIILILWLIAVLTGGWGLGWGIHVLLVIALILLILWLLRII